MALNLAELQQKADRVIHNADEFVRKWVEFLSAPAGTVTLEYYDRNGNLQTVSFSNRNKLVQDFIESVNNAMIKNFYVEAINGNDTNDGSLNAPFKTPKKAIDSIPVGGVGVVRLLSDVELTEDISIRRKHVVIVGEGAPRTINVRAVNVTDNNGVVVGTGIPMIRLLGGSSSINFLRLAVNIPALSSTAQGDQWFWHVRRALVQCGDVGWGTGFYAVGFVYSTLNIGDYAYAVSGSEGANAYTSDGYIYAGRYATTTNLDPDGDGVSTGNGFATSDVQVVE